MNMVFTFYSICVAVLSALRGERGQAMTVRDLYCTLDADQKVVIYDITRNEDFGCIADDIPLRYFGNFVNEIHTCNSTLFIFCE